MGPCRTYPTFSEFTQQLHNFPNNFRIYPTTSEFTQQLQNSPNTFIIYSPLHNLPNTFIIYPTPSEFAHPFRIYPTPSEFTQHLQNLPTPSLPLYPFSFVTMKVHIKDDNFLTPAFSPHIDPFQFVFGQQNRFWGRWTFLDIC